MPQRQCPEACRRPTWRIHAGVDAAAPGSYSADSGPGSGADPAAPRPPTQPRRFRCDPRWRQSQLGGVPRSIVDEAIAVEHQSPLRRDGEGTPHAQQRGDCQPERRRPRVAPNVLAAHSGKQRRCVACRRATAWRRPGRHTTTAVVRYRARTRGPREPRRRPTTNTCRAGSPRGDRWETRPAEPHIIHRRVEPQRSATGESSPLAPSEAHGLGLEINSVY